MQLQVLNPENFRAEITQDMRDLLWLDQQLGTITVSASEAQAWFQAHSHELTQPERWRVAHLFLSGHPKPPKTQIIDRRSDMQQLWQRLQQGETWLSLCPFSEDERSKHHAGDLGWITAVRCPSDFISHIRPMRVGQTSKVVQTKLGWHVIKLLDYQPAQPAKWEAHRSEVTARLQLEKRVAALQALLEKWHHTFSQKQR
jgi:hypothetical protein